MNIFYRNPFIVALWAPIYQLVATIAITNDFLMAAIFIMFTLGLIGAYVSDFPLFPSLYMNEVAHKTSISSLMGMLLGMMLFLAFGTGDNEGSDGGVISRWWKVFSDMGGADPAGLSPDGVFVAWGEQARLRGRRRDSQREKEKTDWPTHHEKRRILSPLTAGNVF